jgi:hypothetical protein
MLFTHGMQTTFDIILNLFFSRMEILGLDNFPKYGPTIIVGNHNNQFADGILLSSKVYELGREVRWKSGTRGSASGKILRAEGHTAPKIFLESNA